MTFQAVETPATAMAALLAPEGRRHPYPHYEALRAHGPLVWIRRGLLAAVGYAECSRAHRERRLVVQDAASFDRAVPGWRAHSSLRGWTDSMLYSNPPRHGRLRCLVSGAFTRRRVAESEPAVGRMTDALLDRLAALGAGGRPVDFMAEFAYRLPVAVIGAMLGVPEKDHEWFRAAAADVTLALEGTTDPATLGTADAAMDALTDYFGTLVRERRARPAGDLIGDLVRTHDEGGRLTGQELTANLVLLLSAGFDTTTHLLGHGLHLAFRHPAQARRLAADPGFAAAYVEECLRYEPPVQATTRWAAADTELCGTPVPEGTKVLVVLAAGNRDPRRFPGPGRFAPGRPDNRPLSFGAGAHHCLGAGLARLEARVALPRLLRRFPHLAPAGEARYRDRWLVRGHESLPVTVA